MSCWIASAAVVMLMSSCQKDYFDVDDYHKIVNSIIPVDSIAIDQDWTTITSGKASVQVNWHEGESYRLQIADVNPADDNVGVVYAAATIFDGEKKTLSFSYPKAAKDLYLVVYDRRGQMVYMHKTTGDGMIEAVVNVGKGDSDVSEVAEAEEIIENPFGIRYCYDDDFPAPGDYDFNDLVLTIFPKIDDYDARKVTIKVMLDAVGTTKQIAAALHLNDLKMTDIDSVVADQPNNFDFGYKYMRSYINSTDILIPSSMNKTKGKDVVINLFNDAHYAISGGLMTGTGVVARYYYNTQPVTGSTGQGRIVAGNVVTYTVYCKTAEAAQKITAENLDPFAVVDFNGAFMEIHPYPYKLTGVMRTYNSAYKSAYNDKYSWCVQVPSYFRYPLEGFALGSYKDGVMTGTYRERGHSFGDWLRGRTGAADWYNYPTPSLIY